MGFDLKKIETDLALEVSGAWTQDLGSGLKLKVARFGNKNFNREITAAAKNRTDAFGNLELEDDVAGEVFAQILANTVLLDWEGLEEDGEPVPYSKEAAARILLQYPEFMRLVQAQAKRLDLFRTQRIEDAAGN